VLHIAKRGEKKDSSDMNVYGTSKIYLIMASKALNEKLKGTGVEVFAAHPGDLPTSWKEWAAPLASGHMGMNPPPMVLGNLAVW
jgi:short-subunit dehydrogenase